MRHTMSPWWLIHYIHPYLSWFCLVCFFETKSSPEAAAVFTYPRWSLRWGAALQSQGTAAQWDPCRDVNHRPLLASGHFEHSHVYIYIYTRNYMYIETVVYTNGFWKFENFVYVFWIEDLDLSNCQNPSNFNNLYRPNSPEVVLEKASQWEALGFMWRPGLRADSLTVNVFPGRLARNHVVQRIISFFIGDLVHPNSSFHLSSVFWYWLKKNKPTICQVDGASVPQKSTYTHNPFFFCTKKDAQNFTHVLWHILLYVIYDRYYTMPYFVRIIYDPSYINQYPYHQVTALLGML